MKKHLVLFVVGVCMTAGTVFGTECMASPGNGGRYFSEDDGSGQLSEYVESTESASPEEISLDSSEGIEAINSTRAFLENKTEAELAESDTFADDDLSSYIEEYRTEFVVKSVQQYDDETIVRYTQTYGGVDIWNSEVVVSDGEDPALTGNYIDLSEAFGYGFEELKLEAETIPDWMQDSEEVRFDLESLKPVIYVDEDNTAYMAHFVTVTCILENDAELTADLVVSLDGTYIFDYLMEDQWEMYDNESFEEATLYGIQEQVNGAYKNGRWYAYDKGRNYYVYAGSSPGPKINEVKIDKLLGKTLSGDGIAVIDSYMYSRETDQWKEETEDYIIKNMDSFNQAYDWYAESLHWYGSKGHGETMVLAVDDPEFETQAACVSKGAATTQGLLVLSQGDVYKSPDVFVHELAHGIQYNLSGTRSAGGGQSGALDEAIGDIFAACFLRDDRWLIAGETTRWRNISKSTKISKANNWKEMPCPTTVDGFLNDYDATHGARKRKNALERFLSWSKDPNFKSDKAENFNANIVSHTVYEIWRDVLDQDYELLAQIMTESLRYLRPKSDFSEFRYAFLHSLDKLHPDEQIVLNAMAKFEAAGIRGTSEWVEKISQAESQSKASMESVSTYYYKVLIPEDWSGKYTAELKEEENCQSLDLYHKASLDANAGGLIASLKLMKENADYTMYPNYEVIGTVISPDGESRRVLLLYHPSDIQYTDQTSLEYQHLEEELKYIVGSLQMLNGYTLETGNIFQPGDVNLPPLTGLYYASWRELNAFDWGPLQDHSEGEGQDLFTVVKLMKQGEGDDAWGYQFYGDASSPNITEDSLIAYSAILFDDIRGSHHMKVTESVTTGMTYEEISALTEVNFMSMTNGGFTACITDPETYRVINLDFYVSEWTGEQPDPRAILVGAAMY